MAQLFPDIDPGEAITAGLVLVDGFPRTNPSSLIDHTAVVTLRRDRPLRGEAKLRGALAAFDLSVTGRVALDIGASAGGFTRVLLAHGASRVYAVDAGFGQLLGSLRQDPRVVNLERTNLADLGRSIVTDRVGVITIDVSYVSLALAVPQLGGIDLEPGAELIALVKPMYELGRADAPGAGELGAAIAAARVGIEASGWQVVASMESPVTGSRGAVEGLLHARRQE